MNDKVAECYSKLLSDWRSNRRKQAGSEEKDCALTHAAFRLWVIEKLAEFEVRVGK